MEKARVGLYTLGCKVAQYETEALTEAFAARGFAITDFSEPCDIYVVNTCTVTAESDRKARQLIRRAHRQNPSARIMVVGCYSQTSPEEVGALSGVAYVSGSDGKMKLPEVAERLLASPPMPPEYAVTAPVDIPFEPMCITRAPRTRAYVKIEDGCECRCTYCAIPGARGTVRSKAPSAVLAEIEGLLRGGTREIVLTGIETASYGVDLDGVRLIDLLERIDAESAVERIRLGSLTPEMMRPDVIERLARLDKLVPHFHLSMQSGSDSVLRRMKRRYNTQTALTALSALRAAMPSVMFTTDLMVGFPGESEEEFAETLAFTREARFLDAHVFAYSRRRGTEADGYPDQVEETVKKQRSARLSALVAEIRSTLLAQTVEQGKRLRVLFEQRDGAYYLGHSDEFIPVRVKTAEDLHGEMYTVLPVAPLDDGLLCVLE